MARMVKRAIESKTNWFALAVAAIPFLEIFVNQPVVTGNSWAFVAIGLAIAVLRSVTKGPVRMPGLPR